ncbi:MAG: hypothetical protein ACOC8P_02690 [Dichotomicrobium sp.]
MTEEDKRKLHEVQQNLANAERAIDAARINLRAVLNGAAGHGQGRRDSGQSPADKN